MYWSDNTTHSSRSTLVRSKHIRHMKSSARIHTHSIEFMMEIRLRMPVPNGVNLGMSMYISKIIHWTRASINKKELKQIYMLKGSHPQKSTCLLIEWDVYIDQARIIYWTGICMDSVEEELCIHMKLKDEPKTHTWGFSTLESRVISLCISRASVFLQKKSTPLIETKEGNINTKGNINQGREPVGLTGGQPTVCPGVWSRGKNCCNRRSVRPSVASSCRTRRLIIKMANQLCQSFWQARNLQVKR